MIRLPELPYNATTDELVGYINTVLIGQANGYSQWGAPSLLTEWDGLDDDGTVSASYANVWSTTEATEGKAFQGLDGNNVIIIQGDNNGLYGEKDWETTQNLTVGVDLTVVRDGFVGRNLEVTNDAHILGDLVVDLTSTLTGNVGIGGAPDGTHKAKVTGDTWITSKLAVGEQPSTQAVRITGDLSIVGDILPRTDNTRDLGSASLQWAETHMVKLIAGTNHLIVDTANDVITVDTDFLVIDRGGDQITVDTDLMILDRSARTLTIGDLGSSVPVLAVTETGGFVGIGTGTPVAPLDVLTGPIRVGGTAAPASGEGLELHWNPTANTGTVLAFDRTGGAFGILNLNGLNTRLMGSGSIKVEVSSTGVGFQGAGAIAKPTVNGSKGGNAALGSLMTALANYGLVTDSTT